MLVPSSPLLPTFTVAVVPLLAAFIVPTVPLLAAFIVAVTTNAARQPSRSDGTIAYRYAYQTS